MNRFFLGASSLLIAASLSAQWPADVVQRANEYQVYVDLTSYADDQLPVRVYPPLQERDTVDYIMPSVVPGTYDISDFGRFVQAFEALDASGTLLPVERIDNNRWQIANARELYAIRYRIDDSFDHPVAASEIFRPGGTSFKDSVHLLNLFGLVGYLQHERNLPFTLQVKHPENLYGATALEGAAQSASVDQYTAHTYFELHDRPILYAQADTASTFVNGTKVTAAVYAAQGTYNAQLALQASAPVLAAIGEYLGGELPTDRYVILLYADAPDPGVMGYGALEHQTSTVLYMPEYDAELMNEEIRDIVAHEFLHIVTPLAIHSEYINDFDFYAPKMSKHLWLYEGVTEYTSMLVQVRAGLITPEEFIDDMEGKMDGADTYNKRIPMTVMSEHVLEIFEDQYGNVYQQGAKQKEVLLNPFMKHFEDVEIGETLITHKHTVTETDIINFANVSGDHFYAHTDVTSLDGTLFEGRVAHGYWILSKAAGMFVENRKCPVLLNYGIDEARFTKPVYPGMTIGVRLTCKEKIQQEKRDAEDIRKGIVKWLVEVYDQENETCAIATILTMVKNKEQE